MSFDGDTLGYIENQYSFSNQEFYKQIHRGVQVYEAQEVLNENNDENNILLVQKIFYYAQEGMKFPIFDTAYQDAIKKRSRKDLVQ